MSFSPFCAEYETVPTLMYAEQYIILSLFFPLEQLDFVWAPIHLSC